MVVFSKAKQAAIDLRLLNPTFPDNPDSKTNKVVDNVLRLYKESDKGKGKITIPFATEEELEQLIGLLDKLK